MKTGPTGAPQTEKMNDSDSSSMAGSMALSDEDTSDTADQPQSPSQSSMTDGVAGRKRNVPDGVSWFSRLFGRKRNGANIRDDLADAITSAASQSEAFSEEEKAMLTSILRLKELRVEDLMVPRADIEAIDISITLAELLKTFEDSGHSRMPVYADTLDDPRGMVHIRDIVAHITRTAQLSKAEIAKRKTEVPANLDLKKVSLGKTLESLKLVRPVLFVPPSMMAMDLMARMQAGRIQMALVIDEYGGTDGLVSMEDVMEEIVGDIEDEHDNDEAELIHEKGEGVFICSAKAELEDIEEAIGESFNAGELAEDVDTIGGLIFSVLGRVPVRGEVINALGYEFRVLDADPRRIKTVELAKTARKRARSG